MVKGLVAAVTASVAFASTPNIVELAESVKDLSTLVSAVVAGDLADTLSSPGPFTVFAPTNEGFAKLPSGTVDDLMKPENKAQLVDILTYHVLPLKVESKQLKSFQRVETVEGKNLHIYKDSRRGVRVTPDGKDFKQVTSADNEASNGVVHIIDGVLLPPADAPITTTTTAPAQPNIVQLAQSVQDLSTLVSAVVAGDLADTLSSPGPFTVFAPTNEGFAKLPAGTVDDLIKPENKAQLVDILTYHVLPLKVESKQLKSFQQVKTVEGKNVHIYKNVFVRGVFVTPDGKDFKKVTSADNEASNGVVHTIDGVLLPPAESSTLGVEAGAITLATFGESDATFRTWKQQNDPVMGGASTGSFSVADGIGTMEGTCALIPRLQAPGFIKTSTSGTFADVSSCTGIELEVRSDTDYDGYRFDFGNDASACGKFFARGYKADFKAPVGSFDKVQIPFNTFTRCWDDASGEAIKTCAEDSGLCPTTSRLQNLQALSVWAEGVEGDVKIDIKSVGAYGCGAGFSLV